MDVKRVAVVTGGTRGIGLGICRALARDGTALALVYHTGTVAAEAACQELSAAGSDVMLVQEDLAAADAPARIVGQVEKRWGRLDILVNNAGEFRFSFLEEMDDAFLDRIMTVNFTASVRMIRAALPLLKKSGAGRILNAGSIAGRISDVGLVAYGCSKASIDMVTRIAAAELAPWGITVNAYSPGIIATDMTRGMIEERGHIQVKQIPVGRFGDPDEVGELIRFLASPAAGYITGENIGVDGGMFKVQNAARAAQHAAQAATRAAAQGGRT
jgi:3-oxoacyl-[acyl-carrier protein] reductase